jgi:hypothetical protein
VDFPLLLSLARLFSVDLPRNQMTNQAFLKSRSFLLAVKESMLKRLFFVLNETNGGVVDYNQTRSAYQVGGGGFKVYVGCGNNAQMIVQQIFKESRWWWSVTGQAMTSVNSGEYEESEEADEDEMQAK